MRTTTLVFEFNRESDQETLDFKIGVFDALPKELLTSFCDSHGVSSDNLVSENIDRDNCLRTVVRSWPDLETATAFVEACGTEPPRGSYPGNIISVAVDPE